MYLRRECICCLVREGIDGPGAVGIGLRDPAFGVGDLATLDPHDRRTVLRHEDEKVDLKVAVDRVRDANAGGAGYPRLSTGQSVASTPRALIRLRNPYALDEVFLA